MAAFEKWYESTLRSAGTCPLRESRQHDGPCRTICRQGLEVASDGLGRNLQWVTAAGWGNPDGGLYIIGTTPKYHPPTVAGPNFAPLGTDRAAHALRFSLADFAYFLSSPDTSVRKTTKWSLALAERWFGGATDFLDRAFFAEMMLCPHTADPPAKESRAAYRQCIDRHLLPLLLRSTERTAVILGQAGSKILWSALGLHGPLPTHPEPAVFRPADELLQIPVIAALAPASRSGLTQTQWLEAVLSAKPGRKYVVTAASAKASRPRKQSPEVVPSRSMDVQFFPKVAFGLTWDYGRRWAVFQSFARGGSIDEVLTRAQAYCDQRCPEFGKTCPRPVEVDRKDLKDYSGFYPSRLIGLGWKVTLSGDRWTVEPPRAS
jgi:hypothetical protein